MPRPSTYAPESPDYLIIDEDRTSNDIGIWIDTPPMPPMAEQVYRELTIPDREENLTVADESYKDIQLAVKAYIFDNAYDMTTVYSWLRGAKKLRFKDDDYYYRVKKVLPPTLNYQGHGKTMITLNFVVSPFRYFVVDTTVISTTSTTTVQNLGNVYCRPQYKIFGSGTIKLQVDDSANAVTVSDVDGYCIIDAERMLIYKDSTFLSATGIIPFLDTGSSSVVVTPLSSGGTFTKLEITRNQRVV